MSALSFCPLRHPSCRLRHPGDERLVPEYDRPVPRVYRSTVLNAPAGEVWARIRDFGSYADWTGGPDRCEIEDGKAGDQVSAVRRPYRGERFVRELLVAHSDVERSYSYELPEPPLPFTNYRATLRVTPVTDGNRSFFEWWGRFDCDPADAPGLEERVAQTYEAGAAALKAHFGGP
jgi:hypothetical protein